MTRPPAPDLSANEARRVAEFEAAEVIEEATEVREEWGVLVAWEGSEEFINRSSAEMAWVLADYWNARADGTTCTVKRRRWVASAWATVTAAPLGADGTS